MNALVYSCPTAHAKPRARSQCTPVVSRRASIIHAVANEPQQGDTVKDNASAISASSDATQEAVSRRTAFGMSLAAGLGVMSTTMRAEPASAAYGEAARIFAPSQEKLGTDYADYQGQGYTISIPQRGFNPTRQAGLAQFPNVDVMWEDMNSTDVATVSVQVFEGKSGMPTLNDMQYLFGQDVWDCEKGNQCSDLFLKEQGFSTGSSVGHIMKEEKVKDPQGNEYIVYDVLTRYQDGSQGGRWHLIKAGSKDGRQYVAQFVAGEKHWAHNQPIAEAVRDSFSFAV